MNKNIGKLYRFGNLKDYTHIWTEDFEEVVKRITKDDVFVLLSFVETRHKGEYIIKVLTCEGVVGYTAIDDKVKAEELIMVSDTIAKTNCLQS